MCDPGKESLCLYGHPNGSWLVNLPVQEVPPELPEPVLGINRARDGMENKEWRLFVAAHSDSWLLAVAFYFSARFGFHKGERKRLYQMINNLPSVYEAVNGEAKPPKDRMDNHKGNRSKSIRNTRPLQSKKPKPGKMLTVLKKEEKSKKKGEDEDCKTSCGACRQYYGPDKFWVCCDMCDRWFHCMCVKITPAEAALIEKYKCPSCSKKKRAKV